MIHYFKTFLIEDAEAWFDSKDRPVIAHINNFSVIFKLFSDNYLSQSAEDKSWENLEQMKQAEGDSAANFISRVIRALNFD